MSSGQWEVVGKSKKSQNGKKKHDDDEKKLKNGPKFEDVSHSQMKSFYAGIEIDDDKKPAKDKKKDGDKKKKEKKAEPSKPKPPKTLEEAFEAIEPADLSHVIVSNKIRFSNAPLVWLKEVASFLNSKIQIDIDDPTFLYYNSWYPLSILPSALKLSLEGVIQDAGRANAQLFYDVTLTALANDMSKGQSVNGHRLLLQMLAQEHPEFCIASIQKSTSLRNSYQNRPPIGLSLLWAFGQGGNSDFHVGLKAWQELFLPIIELKNYTKYVIQYLSKHLEIHMNMDDAKLNLEQLIAMFDMVNSKRNNIPKDLSSDLMKQLSKYKDIYFNKSGNKLQVTFNQLLKKLPNQYLSGSTLDPYNKVILECLIECLARDDSCNETWRQLFHRCIKQSATLADYIYRNWEEVSPRLKWKSLKVTFQQLMDVCQDTMKGKKKDETVMKVKEICQDILDKMTSTRRFPWFWMSFFLLTAIAGLITYDVTRVGGNFKKSATAKLLDDLGLLEYSQQAWQKSLSASARGYLWMETNAPIYYDRTVEVCKPYSQLSKDAVTIAVTKLCLVYTNVKDYIIEKTPIVIATIDEYAPGLIDKVGGYASSGYDFVKKYSLEYYQLAMDYLGTKVFVGEWAPEILQNKTQSALNVAKNQVSTYFHWFREQVHVYSKIP